MTWAEVVKRIPHKVQITAKIWYEILWTPKIHVTGAAAVGHTRPETKQIIIESGNKPKLTSIIYLHELLHAFSLEYNVGLTENQILKLEKAMYFVIKQSNLLADVKKKDKK